MHPKNLVGQYKYIYWHGFKDGAIAFGILSAITAVIIKAITIWLS